MTEVLLVIDAANVVGSVPDGWWRDRAGATERLRDKLIAIAENGLPALGSAEPPEVVLVVEGQASRVRGVPGVRVVASGRSGDEAIVELVERECVDGRRCVVVTADRELRRLVTALGAEVLGPSTVR